MKAEIDKAGGLKLVYIDPPFDVGADFSIEVNVGDGSVTKEASVFSSAPVLDREVYLALLHEFLKGVLPSLSRHQRRGALPNQ